MKPSFILLDTNVVSYLMKNGPLADSYATLLAGKTLTISFITVGEMYYGAEKAAWGIKKLQALNKVLQQFVVIPHDHEVARCYAHVMVQRQRSGRPISLHDAWIAACAVRHAIPLATHNRKDFEGIAKLKIISAC